MQRFDIKGTFHTDESDQDKFLSRLFGIFSEDIVRLWCRNPNSRYNDLGRPTIYSSNERRGKTLDFTFKDKSEDIYIGELKCELEYQNYKFIELDSIEQLDHHTGEAFQRFLAIAKDPQSYNVRINGKETLGNGSILVWGCVNENKKNEIINHFNFHDILSIENIVNDLINWNYADYINYIDTRYRWMSKLMTNLSGGTLMSFQYVNSFSAKSIPPALD